MELHFHVEGMMCPKCEARVRKALEAISGVEKAEVSHVQGTASVFGEGLDAAALKKAVTEAGYTVTD